MRVRLTVGGHTVYGEKQDILDLRHLDDQQIHLYFSSAQENGVISFELRDKKYTLKRNPDYTFEVVQGQEGYVI